MACVSCHALTTCRELTHAWSLGNQHGTHPLPCTSHGTQRMHHTCMHGRPHAQVEAEVKLLIDRLRDVAGTAPFTGSAVRSREPDAVMPRSSGREKAVFDYVSSVAGSLVRGA